MYYVDKKTVIEHFFGFDYEVELIFATLSKMLDNSEEMWIQEAEKQQEKIRNDCNLQAIIDESEKAMIEDLLYGNQSYILIEMRRQLYYSFLLNAFSSFESILRRLTVFFSEKIRVKYNLQNKADGVSYIKHYYSFFTDKLNINRTVLLEQCFSEINDYHREARNIIAHDNGMVSDKLTKNKFKSDIIKHALEIEDLLYYLDIKKSYVSKVITLMETFLTELLHLTMEKYGFAR